MKIPIFAEETFVVDGIGKSAADFAADTLLLFLDQQVKCVGDENAIFACLRRVMENDIMDARRSAPARKTTKVEPISGAISAEGKTLKGLDDFVHRDAVHREVEGHIFKERFYELLEEPEPDLYELVYAIFEENALTPREIAKVIGTNAANVQNRKKRLRTFIATHDLMKSPTNLSL